ncbi:MAG: hypothetical protein OXB88_05530, partial [Bacteriovoracales bacterium]|nr:hypothetical protein [Bacteriovoracales bacterium]
GVGWFGLGWGSRFETGLWPNPDGSVTIQENGTGARTYFTPAGKMDARAAAKKIVNEMKKRNSLTGKSVKKLEKQLVENADLRYSHAKKLGLKIKIRKGTKLFSKKRGQQELIKQGNGFVRINSQTGRREFFNAHGRLTKIKEKSGYTITLFPSNRKSDKELKSIKDSYGKQLFFSWYSSGRVKEIYSSKDRKATYAFDKDNLKRSTDTAKNKNAYDYEYDPRCKNLSKVKYKDGRQMVITYESKTCFTSSITKKNGERKKYKYGHNPKNPDLHYWTEITKDGNSKNKMVSRYEYEIRVKPNGQQYTYRMLTDRNGFKTETIRSQDCELPLKIKNGKQVTTFEYNRSCLLTKKVWPNGQGISLDYNKKCNKVSKTQDKKGWTQFRYNKSCNLSNIINSKGQSILLTYDRKSRITKVVDLNKKTKKREILDFTYNSMGKLFEIKMGGVGKINVKYDGSGQIKKVESKQGHKMAAKITKTFQNLLAIVKPAGVSLSAY